MADVVSAMDTACMYVSFEVSIDLRPTLLAWSPKSDRDDMTSVGLAPSNTQIAIAPHRCHNLMSGTDLGPPCRLTDDLRKASRVCVNAEYIS